MTQDNFFPPRFFSQTIARNLNFIVQNQSSIKSPDTRMGQLVTIWSNKHRWNDTIIWAIADELACMGYFD